MRIAIIDDETFARENIRQTLKKLSSDHQIVGEAASVQEGVKLLQSTPVDLLFLDIDLKDGSGFSILNKLDNIEFGVVFITAYNNYAIDAFRINALDYILKPIDDIEFEQAFSRAKHAFRAKEKNYIAELIREIHNAGGERRLAIRDHLGIRFLQMAEILYCQADKNYTEIHLESGERIVSAKTLKTYTETLEQHGFFRIHQSYLVNLAKVKRVINDDGIFVVLNSEMRIEVSRRKKLAFFESFENIRL